VNAKNIPLSTQHAASIVANLKRLLWGRTVLLAILLIATLAVHYGFDLPVPLGPLLGIIAALALITVSSWWRANGRPEALHERELTWQLTIDVIGLTALLYFSGGWTNPLVSLYLVPIAIAVVMLDRAATWTIMAMTVIGYSLLVVYHRPILELDHHHLDSFTLHVAGMWLTFVLAAGLIAYFGTNIVNQLRAREQALAASSGRSLRESSASISSLKPSRTSSNRRLKLFLAA
jgi:two-component system, sensor histidine kinase RegB